LLKSCAEKIRTYFYKGIDLKKRMDANSIKDKAKRFKIKKLMEKSLFYPGAFNKSFIEKLTTDPHVKTRKKNFYLLQVTVLFQSNLKKGPSSNVIR